jgi:hypothetical protein
MNVYHDGLKSNNEFYKKESGENQQEVMAHVS